MGSRFYLTSPTDSSPSLPSTIHNPDHNSNSTSNQNPNPTTHNSPKYIYGSDFEGNSSSSDGDDDDTTLPFPKPISRSAFLTHDFQSADFLASLTNRFQTLEDLQTELKQLSSTIQTELVDLVNDEYEEFLSLGERLRGGEEAVEGVRVGVLAIERELGVLRERVEGVRREVQRLVGEKRDLKQEGNWGRGMLECEALIRECEWEGRERMADDDEEDEDDDEDSDGLEGRLTRRVEQWECVRYLMGKYGEKHPFVMALQPRVRKVREGLLGMIEEGMGGRREDVGRDRLLELKKRVEE